MLRGSVVSCDCFPCEMCEQHRACLWKITLPLSPVQEGNQDLMAGQI